MSRAKKVIEPPKVDLSEVDFTTTPPATVRPRGEKHKTPTGKKFIGGYVHPALDDLNSLIAEREDKSRTRNLEQLVAFGLILTGYEEEVLKALPNLKFNIHYLRFKEATSGKA